MKEKLTILYNYLKNNDHMQDANRIAKILDEYDKNGDLSELSIKKIKAIKINATNNINIPTTDAIASGAVEKATTPSMA